MAEGKKSFVLYTDLIHTVRKMKDNHAGQLFKTILEYVNDENPENIKPIIDLVFEPIKQQLKRDLREWENERTQRSEAGKKGMKNRWNHNKDNTVITEHNTVKQPITNITDTVIVTVTDTVNDIETNKRLADFEKSCLSHEKWKEEICIAVGGISGSDIPDRLKKFNAHVIAGGDAIGTLKEYKRYFRNWMLNKNYIINKNGNHQGSNGKVPDRYKAGKQDYSNTKF